MARKPARKPKGRTTPSRKKAAAGRRTAARGGAGAARKTARKTGRRTTGAGKRAAQPKRKSAAKRKSPARPASKARPVKAPAVKSRAVKKSTKKTARKRPRAQGLERTLAQTPATGRTVRGRTNPMPTIRSTGTGAGAGDTRRAPALERERRRLRELDETVDGPPSSLNMDRHGSAARTGRQRLEHDRREHTETGPRLTGGDVDADWEDAYAVGDEAPGGDNPTPDQEVVDDIGRALGVEYQDNEELKASDKITERDRHRWELDPASAEDYREHDRDTDEE